MKVLIWEYQDTGHIAVRELWESMRLDGESDADFAKRIVSKTRLYGPPPLNGLEGQAEYQRRIDNLPHKGKAVFVGVRDKVDLPADRSFRNAWKSDLTHDMEKCRHIHRQRMREARAPKLAALDVEYQRADERGDVAAKREIASRKQRLRDITDRPEISKAETPDQLKRVWPEELS